MTKPFKPMLAASTIPALADIKYPVYASPKLDGIRCLVINGEAVSRNLKPIPNDYVRKTLAGLPPLDGELIINGDFNAVQSAIMSKHGEPDFTYQVFDRTDMPFRGFGYRTARTAGMVYELMHPLVTAVDQVLCSNEEDLAYWYETWLAAGYEGAIVRSIDGRYKFGRSTLKEGIMLKLKPFDDAEAKIVGYAELMHNNDTSCNKIENLVGGNTLGSLITQFKGQTVHIGSGFDAQTRARLWAIRDDLVGQLVTFKYQGVSRFGVPRFPIFKSIREPE